MNTVAYVGLRIDEFNHVSRINDDGRALPLMRRLDLRRHAAEFNWGTNNSGAAQLAIAILSDALGDDDTALDYYQHFKSTVLRRLGSAWVLEVNDVTEWLLNQSVSIAEFIELDRVVKGGAL